MALPTTESKIHINYQECSPILTFLSVLIKDHVLHEEFSYTEFAMLGRTSQTNF